MVHLKLPADCANALQTWLKTNALKDRLTSARICAHCAWPRCRSLLGWEDWCWSSLVPCLNFSWTTDHCAQCTSNNWLRSGHKIVILTILLGRSIVGIPNTDGQSEDSSRTNLFDSGSRLIDPYWNSPLSHKGRSNDEPIHQIVFPESQQNVSSRFNFHFMTQHEHVRQEIVADVLHGADLPYTSRFTHLADNKTSWDHNNAHQTKSEILRSCTE